VTSYGGLKPSLLGLSLLCLTVDWRVYAIAILNTQEEMKMKEIIDPNYEPKGERECKCAVCHRVFTSTEAFDMHRVGEYGVNRTCLNLSLPNVSWDVGLSLKAGRWMRFRE